MSNTPHELAEEFPHMIEEMSNLKSTDGHFSRLFDEYHTLNRAIHRAETNIEPTDDYHMLEMRRKRVQLKDQIASCLALA